jgi:hypothetical protein
MSIHKNWLTKLFYGFKRKTSTQEEAGTHESPQPAQPISTKCPQCGNAVECLLPAMKPDDPAVYKCAHCLCTITHPGTSKTHPNDHPVHTWSQQEKIIHLESDTIRFTGKIHGSVGWEYQLIYPQESFQVHRKFAYLHPEMMEKGRCGGDEATVEYTLKPLKTGLFCITEQILFRGHLEENHTHYFLVTRE